MSRNKIKSIIILIISLFLVSYTFGGTGYKSIVARAAAQCAYPPTSGDWILDGQRCDIGNTIFAPANVVLRNNSQVVILNTGRLYINLKSYNLRVQNGSGILIKNGGKLAQGIGTNPTPVPTATPTPNPTTTPQPTTTPPSGDAFLDFPVPGQIPSEAPITSLFDHSMKNQSYKMEQTNGKCEFMAINGAYGHIIANANGDYYEQKCYYQTTATYNMNPLPSFTIDNNPSWSNINYTDSNYLFYDGHPGYDYEFGTNTPLYAPAEGYAYLATEGTCNILVIEHPQNNGVYKSVFFHMDSFASDLSSSKKYISKGNYLGSVGSQCAGTAVHLHYELRYNNIPVDPYGWKGSGSDPYTRATNKELWTGNSVVATN